MADPNLGPSYNFHRNPFQRAGAGQNIESAEYANIVLDALYYYEQARARGHEADLRVPRADTAGVRAPGAVRLLDAQRLPELGHGPVPVSLAPVALLGLVVPGPARDRQLEELRQRQRAPLGEAHVRPLAGLYERFTERWDDDRREPGSSLYGITTKFSEGRHFELARFQALAAEAVLRGMGDDPAEEPPRCTPSTPRSAGSRSPPPPTTRRSCAVSNGAFPYGGIDIARWFDSRQRVISHIGGRAPAGFGMVVRAPNGKIVTGSQRPRTLGPKGRIPLILNKSPQGPITR